MAAAGPSGLSAKIVENVKFNDFDIEEAILGAWNDRNKAGSSTNRP